MTNAATPSIARQSPDWYDSMYNNRALVPDHADYFQRWAASSVKARAQLPALLDLAYGDSPGQKLDIFPASPFACSPNPGAGAPVMVFIHGGYWRSLDKADHSFVATAFTQSGACVVVPNYDLCPAVTVPEICLQMVKAVAWTWQHIADHGGDANRITVVGHSAGGHLATMLLSCLWQKFDASLPADVVKNALSISGLYDLEPIRRAPFVQGALQLTTGQVKAASPFAFARPVGRTLYSVAGGLESAEFLRQNQLIASSWGTGVVPLCEALAGLNHFSVVDALAKPGHRLHDMAQSLLAKTHP